MSYFINIQTGEFPFYEGDIRAKHPEIPESATGASFPLPPEYAPVLYTPPSNFDPLVQSMTEGAPIQRDGKYYVNWIVTDLPEEIAAINIRNKRGKELAASDWTQLLDSPVDKTAWAAYRQALRDIPSQPGFPMSVVWPAKPQ